MRAADSGYELEIRKPNKYGKLEKCTKNMTPKEIIITQYLSQGLWNDFKALFNLQSAGITYNSRWHKEVTSLTIDNGEIRIRVPMSEIEGYCI